MVSDAWPVLSDRGLGFLNDNLSSFEDRAGVRQGLIGSLILIAFVAVIAVPARDRGGRLPARSTRATRGSTVSLIANIRNLAGVPSIVYGILGVVVFAQTLAERHGARDSKVSATSPEV